MSLKSANDKFCPPGKTLPLFKDNWEDYFLMNSTFGICGYLEGTERTIEALDFMVSNASSFQQLKADLGEYIKERKEFLESAPAEKWALSEKQNQEKYRTWLKDIGIHSI